MRPRSADTSEPACTKRKMLSMKSSTSWPPSSRKYSAIVRPRQAHAQPGARRLVHLAVDERRLLDDPALLHLEPEVVALAGALAHAGEHRQAAVLLGDVVDQLLDQHRLAHAGAAEEADLAALHVGREEVDDLDAGLEDLLAGVELVEGRGVAVDRPALAVRHVPALVDGVAEHVEEAAERRARRPAPRSGRRCRVTVRAAGEAVGGVEGDRADAVVAQVLLHLGDQRRARRRRGRSRGRCRCSGAPRRGSGRRSPPP